MIAEKDFQVYIPTVEVREEKPKRGDYQLKTIILVLCFIALTAIATAIVLQWNFGVVKTGPYIKTSNVDDEITRNSQLTAATLPSTNELQYDNDLGDDDSLETTSIRNFISTTTRQIYSPSSTASSQADSSKAFHVTFLNKIRSFFAAA